MLDAYMLSVAAHNIIFAFHFSLGSLHLPMHQALQLRFTAIPCNVPVVQHSRHEIYSLSIKLVWQRRWLIHTIPMIWFKQGDMEH
jgi:hypothetical protein